MRILFIVPYVPSLIRTRSYNLIRGLARHGHRLTVMTLWTDAEERAQVEALREDGLDVIALDQPRWRSIWNCLWALPGGRPLQSVYSWQPALGDQIASLLGPDAPFDIIHVEHLRGSRYALLARELAQDKDGRRPPIPIVWDSVDCISHLFRQAAGKGRSFFSRQITRFELGRTERMEGELVGRFDRVLASSETDRGALLALANGQADELAVNVIGNGVDLSYFRPDPSWVRDPNTLVVSGKMSYHANVSMVVHLFQDIMPLVWQQRPDARLTVVGKDPPGIIEEMDSHPNVTVTGTVDDMRPYLGKAAAALIPLTYGAGSQFKVLEAMAVETPVVASPLAVSALAARPGEDLLVAEDAVAFADAILRLLDNPEERHRLGQNGRRYVEKQHEWDGLCVRLENIYQELLPVTPGQEHKGIDGPEKALGT